MPASSTIVDGSVTRRPGAYSEVDTSSLASVGAQARGVVALVMSAERLQPKVPVECNTARQLKEALPDSGAQLADLLFRPSKDSRIKAGASKVVVCRVDPATRASLALDDAAANASLVFYAYDWGAFGSRISVQKTAGTTTGHKVVASFDGTTETLDNIGGGDAFTARYSEAEATTMVITVDPTADPRVLVRYTKTAIPYGTYTPSKMAFDGPITFEQTVAAPGGGTTYTVTGLASDGSTSEVVTIGAGTTGPQASSKSWVSVTDIVTANDPGAGTWSIAGAAFSLDRTTYDTIQKVVDRINAKSGQGFAATVVTTRNPSTFDVANLDSISAADIMAAADGPKHDLWSIITTVNQESSYLTAERAAGADQPPADMGSASFLAGGANGSPTSSDYEDALAALKDQFVNSVWLDSTAAANQEKLRQHLVYMWGQGRDERNGYVGVPTDTAKADVLSKAAALNSPYMQLCAQEIQVYDPTGAKTWLSPAYQALLGAGMQAGSTVGTPLTWKHPNVLDFRQASDWSPAEDANDMIKGGVMFMSRASTGIQWERSVTTYLQADDPILTEMSALESAGESTKDLRRFVEIVIGQANVPGTAKQIYGYCAARLDKQKNQQDLGLIKDWDKASLEVEDTGDGFDIGYNVAPLEPINFIRITARAVRIPASS